MLEIKSLLDNVKAKIEEAEKIAILKGENFNVFSILNMESAENKTHSAFLCELLNPAGSHGFGSRFLNLFVKTLLKDNTCHEILKSFEVEGASVVPEFFIGQIDYKRKVGGRLDIIITDNSGRNIIIENKIYAKDQDIQIERYCNYKTEQSVVFYLTLEGNQPVKKSSGKCKVGEDFFLLSYKATIVEWLTQCQKEAVDQAILRESIKQYAILIKKLTNQLTSDVVSEEIKDIIKQNLKGAKGVADHYYAVVNEIKEAFRNEVRRQLQVSEVLLNHEWRNSIDKGNANVFIDTEIPSVKFLIESFSGRGWMKNGLCVGIWINLDKMDNANKIKVKDVFKNHGLKDEGWWFGREALGFDMASLDDLSKLTDELFIEQKAKEITSGIKEYIQQKQNVIKELTELTF